MTTITPVDRAIDHVVTVLRRNPAGLFTDIDGTISQVARVPSEAFVAESARDSLRRLGSAISIVGAITGRGAADAASMLGLDGTVVIGNHGYERLRQGERLIHPSALGSRASVATSTNLLLGIVEATPQLANVVIENKDLSASVHYRLVEDQGHTVALLRQLVGAIAELHELNVTDGKFVYEIRPRALVNKGTAIHDISNRTGTGRSCLPWRRCHRCRCIPCPEHASFRRRRHIVGGDRLDGDACDRARIGGSVDRRGRKLPRAVGRCC